MSFSLRIDIEIETTKIVVEIGTTAETGHSKEILGDTLHRYNGETKTLGNMKELVETDKIETETEKEEGTEIDKKVKIEETGTEKKEKMKR